MGNICCAKGSQDPNTASGNTVYRPHPVSDHSLKIKKSISIGNA